MRIAAEFVTSVACIDQLPKERLPEIALTGRSNVGKSSLINALLAKPGLARTSNTPGRTQTLNYYLITPENSKPFFIVDMPGYGFATANQRSRAQWSDLIEQYVSTRPTLCGIMQLLDLRHPPQPLDYSMSQWLKDIEKPRLVVGTKADKVAKTKVAGLILEFAVSLNIDSRETLAFSAETGFGKDRVLRWVLDTAQTQQL